MTNHEEATELVQRWRQGDEEAANLLFGRYVERMMRVIGQQMSARVAVRVDPEDVVQSVFRTVFRRMKQGEFEFRDDGDLWRLLVTVALNKARSQANRNSAARRDVRRETSIDDAMLNPAIADSLQSQPKISEVLAFREALDLLFQRLGRDEARLVQLRLEGYNQEEISEQLGCTPRTVRRKLATVREVVSAMFMDGLQDEGDETTNVAPTKDAIRAE